MIKHKIIFCCALATLLATGINGASATSVIMPSTYRVKCVKPATSCSKKTIADYSFEWSATCNSTTITGIATCGYDDVNAMPSKKTGATADKVTYYGINGYDSNDGSSAVNDRVCWCRMITPALSYWVYAGNYTPDDDTFLFTDRAACRAGCAQQCSSLAASNATFRSALFENLQ